MQKIVLALFVVSLAPLVLDELKKQTARDNAPRRHAPHKIGHNNRFSSNGGY